MTGPFSAILHCVALTAIRPCTHGRVSRQKPARNLLGDIFVEETVEKLDEPKREQVLYFLDGNGETCLVEFLDSLTRNSDEENYVFRPSSSWVVCTRLDT